MAEKKPLEAIRALSGTRHSAGALVAGAAYAVPGQVSDKDARTLITIKKAEAITAEEAKKLQAEAAKAAKVAAKAAEDAAAAAAAGGAAGGGAETGGAATQ